MLNNSEESVIEIYIDHYSQPSRTVHIACMILNLPFRIVSTRISEGSHQKSPFKEINPLKALPGIKHGELRIGESTAILRYLGSICERNEKSMSFYPKSNIVENLKIEQYFKFHHTKLRVLYRILWAYLFAKAFNAEQFFDKGVEDDQTFRILTLFEEIYLKNGNSYILGTTFTICDIVALSEIMQLNLIDYDIKGKFPLIWQWIKRMKNNDQIKIGHAIMEKTIRKMGYEYYLD